MLFLLCMDVFSLKIHKEEELVDGSGDLVMQEDPRSPQRKFSDVAWNQTSTQRRNEERRECFRVFGGTEEPEEATELPRKIQFRGVADGQEEQFKPGTLQDLIT